MCYLPSVPKARFLVLPGDSELEEVIRTGWADAQGESE